MKILFFIFFIGYMTVACSNDRQTPEVSTTQPEKYDINKDSTVSAGE